MGLAGMIRSKQKHTLLLWSVRWKDPLPCCPPCLVLDGGTRVTPSLGVQYESDTGYLFWSHTGWFGYRYQWWTPKLHAFWWVGRRRRGAFARALQKANPRLLRYFDRLAVLRKLTRSVRDVTAKGIVDIFGFRSPSLAAVEGASGV